MRRHHTTKHRVAMSDPATAILVKRLRAEWDSIDPIEIGDRLRALLDRGCSTRGLEYPLGVSDTTIRRFVRLASLSDDDRAAIKNGASAKAILARKSTEARKRQSAERLRQERATGALSDEVANITIEFCRGDNAKSKTAISRPNFAKLLGSVAQYLSTMDDRGVPVARISKRLTLAQVFKRLRPRKDDNEFWIEHHARWLADVIRTFVPERAIWEVGLRKAEKREKELEPERTVSNMLDERADAIRAFRDNGPFPPPRPPYPGGAEKWMTRQGSQKGSKSRLASSERTPIEIREESQPASRRRLWPGGAAKWMKRQGSQEPSKPGS